MNSGTLGAVIAGFAVSCASVFSGQTCATRFIAAHVSSNRSQAVGLYLMSYYIGGTFGGWLPETAYQSHGWISTLIMVGAVIAIATVAALSAWRGATNR